MYIALAFFYDMHNRGQFHAVSYYDTLTCSSVHKHNQLMCTFVVYNNFFVSFYYYSYVP